eukprot:TRINITY_DN21944_c0_g1_i1.p1 TRINITY_DN21944_c0_g1~~TRINITY_DN21944_c0_g1_i1.p1  ORF type:complete len:297 (+),score=29.10 TRINITY_DN21944_c0_g1_i1:134-892(+)
MISSTNVFFMMCTSWLWGLEQLGGLRIVSAMLMILGGFFQGLGYQQAGGQSTQFQGALMQAASMILGCQRWALAQYVMKRLARDTALGQLHKIELLAYTLPLTGLICVPLAFIFEPGAYTLEELSSHSVHLVLSVGTVSLGLIGMLFAELKLVDYFSAVAFNVIATVQQIPIVLAGVVLCHNHVGLWAAAGFGSCIIGALVYAEARSRDILNLIGRSKTAPHIVPSDDKLEQLLSAEDKQVSPKFGRHATHI